MKDATAAFLTINLVRVSAVASLIFYLSSFISRLPGLIQKDTSPDQCQGQDCQPKAQVFGVVILFKVPHIRFWFYE